ncbi:psbP domain-containing protein 2, chloroplastic [Magnolia sinica]|uniref:psbP domain-containing protein 2, chloroplastic n=1 Tax=Magnolia sinica TaxID=86752 RepID=UPI00265A5F23|nr:psbP domain-containing protein 2, chloroplastic [Magnolia sinica]
MDIRSTRTGSICLCRIPFLVATLKPTTAVRCSSSSHPQIQAVSASTRKRTLILSVLSSLCFPSPIQLPFSSTAAAVENQLERYTDPNEGFTLLLPPSWIKVEKAGATALFEDGRGNNVGVVVTPVRLSSLPDFGSPQFVADKLIQAEKRKESTKDAEVIGVAERLGNGDLPVYEFEYKVDSTRGGMKRIFSAAFISSKKLYLLNIAYADRMENPLDMQTRLMLEQVLHSFDVASSSSSSSSM